MKKKIMMALGAVALSFSLFAGAASAEWAACTPTQIGPGGGAVFIKVSGCNKAATFTGTTGYMQLSTNGTDQMMATVLTAMSLGKKIAVEYTGAKGSTGYMETKSLILSM